MKRAIALILALAFAFALVPVSALAADGELKLTVIKPGEDPDTYTATLQPGAPAEYAKAEAPADPTMEFWKWTVEKGEISSLVGFDTRKADNRAATSALVATDPETELTIKANYRKIAGNDIEFSTSGVAVSVNGTDNFDSTLPRKALAGDLVRVRVGASTDTFRLVGVSVKRATVNLKATEVPEESGTDTDGQAYKIYKFTMPDEAVKISVIGDYLVTLSGATFGGIADGDIVKMVDDTKAWVRPGSARKLIIVPQSDNVVQEWSAAPETTFSYNTNKTEATFDMPSAPMQITVRYESKYTYIVKHQLVSTGEELTSAPVKEPVGEDVEVEVFLTKTFADSTVGKLQDFVISPSTLAPTVTEPTSGGSCKIEFPMPAENVTITLRYAREYKLKIEDAVANVDADPHTSGDAVSVGRKVVVKAEANTQGKVFDYWQYAPASSKPANVEEDTVSNSAKTSFDMPIADADGGLTVTAHYKYNVELKADDTVADAGTINGTDQSNGVFVAPGELVTIAAAAPKSSTKVFKEWEVTAGPTGFDASDLVNSKASTTAFNMPKGEVKLTATYADAYSIKTTSGAIVRLRDAATGSTEITVAASTELTAVASGSYGGYAFEKWELYPAGAKDFTKPSSLTVAEQAVRLGGIPESDLEKRTIDFAMTEGLKGCTLRARYTGTAYYLYVVNGDGTGYFASDSDVTITAPALMGKKFSYWTLTKYEPTGLVTETVYSDSYTFKMPAYMVSATATYETLYLLTLSNTSDDMKTAENAGKLSMTLPGNATATPPTTDKTVANAAGETSISAYWSVGDVITITTPDSVKLSDGGNAVFTGWVVVSGNASIANAANSTTTATMTAANTVLAARYGGNMLLYKDAERVQSANENITLPTYRYDEWTYEDVTAGTIVTMKADDPDGTFKRWACEPADLISDKTARQISFNMPNGPAKIWPEYVRSMKLTDAEYSLDGGTTWTLGGGTDAPVSITAGDTVMIRPVEDLVGSGTAGKYIFKSWSSNSTLVGSGSTVKQLTFRMPPEDLEIAVIYQSYTLTVNRFVDASISETYTLRPGEHMTFTSADATGGRCFNYWTGLDSLASYTIIDKYDAKDKDRLLGQELTIEMGTTDAYVHAWYSLYPRYDYWSTGAFIRMTNEPKRYYGMLEYFNMDELQVQYYANAGAEGQLVSNSDLVCQVVYPGTTTRATDVNGCFTSAGQFELLITLNIAGYQMAPTLRVMNTASSYITCYDIRPEYVRNFNKLFTNVYFEGEEVKKDGLDVWLVSADHVSGSPQYFSVRELGDSDYKLYPRGYLNINADGLLEGFKEGATTKLPTVAEIQAAIAAGRTGYKVKDGKYYVQMWIYAVDETQTSSTTGKPTIMQYLINNESDAIWVEVRQPVVNIELEAVYGNNGDTVDNVPQAVYPHVSWIIQQGTALSDRYLTIDAQGWTGTVADLAAALEVVNNDPNVAYLEDASTSTQYRYKVIVKAPGVTTITVRARGDAATAVKATCEITVQSNTDPIPMRTFGSLNKTAVNLFVGNKLTLYPTEFTPANADKTCNWEVVFTDGLLPQNAENYVTISAAGVVEVLKYTDRPVRVYAYPAYPLGQNTPANRIDKKTDCLSAFCDIGVLEIPVDNMTLSPATLTMFRQASKQLKVTVYPEAASDKTIIWTSSDSNIASVKDGVVTANMLGTVTITAKSRSNEDVFQTCTITIKESVLLTSLMLNKTSANLGIDDTMVLTPYYSPATATTQTVTWTSSDPAVATVDANGKVRGISEGATIITATSNDGSGKKATCVLSVSTIVASAIVLNKQTLALIEEDTETLTATVYPTNVSTNKVIWSSSNERVVTVDVDGVVTAVGGGSAVITATAKDSSTKYADCVVVVTPKIPVTAMTLNLGSFDLLLNDTTAITAAVTPSNATYKLTFTSSDPKVATVDEKGKISGLSTGTTLITAKAGDVSIPITVNVVTKMYTVGKVVNCARRVNVRTDASGTSGVAGYAYLGSEYKVLDKSGNWYKIQYNATTTAYIWHRYISAGETAAGYTSAGKIGATTPAPGTTATPVPVAAKTVTVVNCTICVNVRSGAGTTFSKLGYAYLNETFPYTGVSNGWYTIEYKGVTGYISSQFVQVNG